MLFWKCYTLLWEALLIIPISILWMSLDISFKFITSFVLLLVIQFTIWAFLKLYFFKERPRKMKYDWYLSKIAASAFPSLHSANTFLLFLFSLDYWNLYISLGFFIFWLSISYSRIVLKKHFYVDLINWAILASAVYVFYKINIELFANII